MQYRVAPAQSNVVDMQLVLSVLLCTCCLNGWGVHIAFCMICAFQDTRVNYTAIFLYTIVPGTGSVILQANHTKDCSF